MINSIDNVQEFFCKGQFEVVNKIIIDNVTFILIVVQEGYEDCIKLLFIYNVNFNILVIEYMGVVVYFVIYKEYVKLV